MKLSKRFETWYAGGEKGLITICEGEHLPSVVKDKLRLWYLKGRIRFDPLVAEVKELEQ